MLSGKTLSIRLVFVFVTLVQAGSGLAADRFWTNVAGGNWNDPGNWDTGVPGVGDTAHIELNGTYTVTVNVAVSIDSLVLGAASGVQTLAVSNSLTLAAASTVGTNGVLNLGSTLTGAGDITVSGAMNWTAGTMTGTGTTRIGAGVPSAATLSIAPPNGGTVTLGRILENNGTATFTSGGTSGSTLAMNAGTLTNNGTFNANTAAIAGNALDVRGDGGVNLITNNGAFNKQGSPGVLRVFFSSSGVAFNNAAAGVVDVQGGTLSLDSGGTSTGAFSVAATSILSLSGTHAVSSPAAISGAGTIRVTGGTATFTDVAVSLTGTVSLTGGTANFNGTYNLVGGLSQSGGILGGSGTITFGGASSWTAGTMTGTGTTRIGAGVPSAATLSIAPSNGGTVTLGRVLENNGTATFTSGGTSGSTLAMNAGTLTNNGTFNANTAAIAGNALDVRGDGGVNLITNNGAFNKQGSPGVLRVFFSSSGVAFNNAAAGVVDVQGGTLSLDSGGTSTGAFSVAATSILSLSGTHAVSSPAAISGAGTIRVTGGTATFTDVAVSLTGTVSLTGGTANFNGTYNLVGGLSQSGGILGGSGTITFGGASSWTAGTMTGTGTTRIGAGVPSAATLSIAPSNGGTVTLGRVLENNGTATFTSGGTSGSTLAMNAGTLTNNGTFNANTAAIAGNALDVRGDGGVNLITNNGAFNKQGSPGVLRVFFSSSGVAFNNAAAGVVDVQGGTLSLDSGGTSTGAFSVAATSILSLSGTHAVSSPAAISGAGTIRVTGGTATFTDVAVSLTGTVSLTGGTANFNGTYNLVGGLSQSGGILGGSGTITFGGASSWTAGTMTGTGTTRIGAGVPSAATLSIAPSNGGTVTLGRVLENNGTATFTSGGTSGSTLAMNAGTLTNNGTFNANTAAIAGNALDVRGDGGVNLITNNGAFNKQGSPGVLRVFFSSSGVAFNNAAAGVVDVQGGTLSLDSGGTSTGAFSVAATSILSLSGTHAVSSPAAISGAGTIRVTGGTATFTDVAVSLTGTVSLTGGTANFNGTYNLVGGLSQSGGILGGSGTITFGGASSWTAGTMTGTGTTRIGAGVPSAATLSIAPSNGGTVTLGRVLENNGTATFTSGGTSGSTLAMNAGTLTNNGTFNANTAAIAGNALDVRGDGGVNLITNNGAFNKQGSPGVLRVFFSSSGVAFNNAAAGMVDVQAGTLSLESVFTNFAATTLTGGSYNIAATLKFANANIVTNAATIVLDGPASAIVNQANANGIANFATNAAAGSFTIKNGRNYARTGVFNNAGQVRVGPGASTFSTTGDYVQTAGDTTLDGGTLDPTNLANIQGGSFGGNGTVTGNVTNAGTAKPGLSAGCLTVTGDYSQTAAGTLEIEKAGPSACPVLGGYDRLSVSGSATLDGGLVVALLGGYEPVVGTTFDIVTAAAVAGTFATTNLPVNFMNDCKALPTYGVTFVRLTAVQGGLFTQQPQSQTICAGDPVTFTVVVTGEPPLTYQWRKGGVDISGATGSSLVIDPVTVGDAGDYDCVVTNICGSRFSSVATLTVNVAPIVTDDPDSQTHCQGATANFSVTATGTPAPTYQWRKNTIDITGATGSSYSIPNVQPADVGSYDCVVTNVCGTDTSTAALLAVNVAPNISDDPDSVSECAGSNVSFSVTASGTPAPTFQWRKNLVAITGATGSSYTINNAQTGDSGSYDCVATNICGVDTSAAASLTVFASGSGDVNGDTLVNGRDVQFFVNALLSGGPPSPGYCAGDMNVSGTVETGDLAGFVALLLVQ